MDVVILECSTCIGPVTNGIRLTFRYNIKNYSPFLGGIENYQIPLLETAGWLKDPQNSLLPWTTPSKCDMIQVLSRLSVSYCCGI